jgi:hypothetical protein
MYFDVTTTRYDIVNTVIKQQHWKLYGETGLELLYTKNTIPIFNLGLGLEYSKNKIDVGISGGFNASYEDSFNPGFYVKTLVRYNFLKF